MNTTILKPTGERDHVELRIVPAEAAIVRAIFQAIADGRGVSGMATELNARHVPSPGLIAGWTPTGVRSLLHRELYRGRIVFGRRGTGRAVR